MNRSPQLEYYYKNKEKCRARTRKWHAENKEQANRQAKEWQKKNPEAQKLINEKAKAKSFGLTIEEYRNLKAKTHCEICAEVFTKSKHKHIDHCHETNKVRGVLCSKCNLAIGMMRDNPVYLRLTANYLEKQ